MVPTKQIITIPSWWKNDHRKVKLRYTKRTLRQHPETAIEHQENIQRIFSDTQRTLIEHSGNTWRTVRGHSYQHLYTSDTCDISNIYNLSNFFGDLQLTCRI